MWTFFVKSEVRFLLPGFFLELLADIGTLPRFWFSNKRLVIICVVFPAIWVTKHRSTSSGSSVFAGVCDGDGATHGMFYFSTLSANFDRSLMACDFFWREGVFQGKKRDKTLVVVLAFSLHISKGCWVVGINTLPAVEGLSAAPSRWRCGCVQVATVTGRPLRSLYWLRWGAQKMEIFWAMKYFQIEGSTKTAALIPLGDMFFEPWNRRQE